MNKWLMFLGGTIIGLALIYGLSLKWSLYRYRISVERTSIPAVLFKAPGYHHVINQNGRMINSAAFSGKIQVVTFLWPLCSSMCPIIGAHMAELERQLKHDGLQRKVQIVSFNVGSGLEKAPIAKLSKESAAFMHEYGADPHDPLWQFLSSPTQAQMNRIVQQGFHEYFQMISLSVENKIFSTQQKKGTFNYMPNMVNHLAEQKNPDFDITHSSSILIVGRHGSVRYVFDNADNVKNSKLLDSIRTLLRN